MSKPKIVKCRYSHCSHDSREMNAEEAVKSGNAYYHPNCYEVKDNIRQITAMFTENVNSNVVHSQLAKIINDIVFAKGIASELLLFGLNYYISNKIRLNYPAGLYYVVQNKEMLNAYKLSKQKKIEKSWLAMDNFETEEDEEINFKIKTKRNTGFEAILRK